MSVPHHAWVRSANGCQSQLSTVYRKQVQPDSSGSSSSSNSRTVCFHSNAHMNCSTAATYEQNCRILEAGAALCKAEIADLPEGRGRGMVATQVIPAGDSVLEVAAANTLAVPKHEGAVGGWLEWLKRYTAAHGPLPHLLLEFLADTRHSPTVRLASWLLYLRACCCSSEGDNAGSSSTQPASHLWCSYISLLQACGDMTAACTGAWRDVELQQLEPPVLKAWVSCHNRDARKATLAAYTLLAGGQHAVAQLGLAPNSRAVGWALSLVKTRAHGDACRLSLFPLHDLINHRERGQANCRSGRPTVTGVDVGYSLLAVSTIQPGEEVTNSYTAPLSNPHMLLGWGFTQPAKAGDWVMAVPRHYGMLPQIPWQVAVQAAAQAALKQKGGDCQKADATAGPPPAGVTARLVSAAANLPLQLPDSIWDGGQAYAAAVAALAAHARVAPSWQQQTGQLQTVGLTEQQQQQHEPEQVFQPLVGNLLQQEKIEAMFARDLQAYLHLPAQLEGQNPTPLQRNRQQQQAWTAAAAHNACLGHLAACTSTAVQDMALLEQLQQQDQHHSTQGLPSFQQPQQPTDRLCLLQQFDQLQQQVVQKLALLAAYSNQCSTCDATAASAEVVLAALQQDVQQLERELGLTGWRQGRGLKAAAAAVMKHSQQCIPQLMQQQAELVEQLQQLHLQQTGSTQLQPQHSRGSQPGQEQSSNPSHCGAAAATVAHEASLARVTAAVAARLEQKLMLASAADLCQEVKKVLASK